MMESYDLIVLGMHRSGTSAMARVLFGDVAGSVIMKNVKRKNAGEVIEPRNKVWNGR